MVRGLDIFQERFAAYVDQYVLIGGTAATLTMEEAGKEQGAKVDAKDVRKHLNDVLRLSRLLAPATRIPVDKKIGDDMTRFLVAVAANASIDPKALQLGNVAVTELVARIAEAYEIELPAQAAG